MPPAPGTPYLIIKQLDDQDRDALGRLNEATIAALNEEEPSMPQPSPTAVAKAALDQATFVKSLDGLTPVDRAARLAERHEARSPVTKASAMSLDEFRKSLDGLTPVEAHGRLLARREGR